MPLVKMKRMCFPQNVFTQPPARNAKLMPPAPGEHEGRWCADFDTVSLSNALQTMPLSDEFKQCLVAKYPGATFKKAMYEACKEVFENDFVEWPDEDAARCPHCQCGNATN